MDRRKLKNELDMLQGNINRMCVTDDEEELLSMQEWAKTRIDRIYSLNKQRLEENCLMDENV